MAALPRTLLCLAAALALLATAGSAAGAAGEALDTDVTPESTKDDGLNKVPDYYDCDPSQRANFSSHRVEERFQRVYGSAERGSERMPLLMVAMEREQLTKGRIHVADAMNIAKLTNRTFVLSRVGESRVSLEKPYPMCTYFDTQRIGQFVDWVDYKAFAHKLPEPWQPMVSGAAAAPVGTPLTTFSVIFMKAYQPCFPNLWKKQLTHQWLYNTQKNERVSQWAKDVLRPLFKSIFDANEVFCVHENDWRALTRLTKDARFQAADLVVVFNAADWIFSDDAGILEAAKHLTFAPHLVKAAARLVESQLGQEVDVGEEEVFQAPYVAIQWRTEYAGLVQESEEATPAGMMRCAEGMVDFVSRQIKSQGQGVPFLAADMDAQGRPASKSFFYEPLVQQTAAKAAIKVVYEGLNAFSWRSFDPNFSNIDNGVQGILDKVVCMGAHLFVFAPPECGGKDSSFTRSILLARHNMGRPSQCWTCEESEEIPKGWLRAW